ncbi:ABC transporter ATP-binding protein [Thauera sinica]|uniref:ABC transporter ATP-binding protein n=1 Tax=Thauera sinica TaxID=2665146 RepID=A0ABW1AT45_9RHOO|nr:ABC transporter ATP-binding protein [Thauera sp. K11]ATE58946.1 nitrate ABC transporter ATP-binding protein [Thauera sp. K11]
MRKIVRIEDVGQTFDTKNGRLAALCGITLDIHEGECIGLVGPAGCGKSTLLNLIAGLARPSTGVILCNGRPVAGPAPERTLVFQNHALLPWLTCFDNVYLAVERVFGGREGKAGLKQRTHDALARVGLAHAETRFPHEIPAGMKQRVGLARALSMQPRILLLDDPFAALDTPVRVDLQDELLKILAATGTTVVMATHDVDEAVLLSDRVAMLTRGPGATLGGILEPGRGRPHDRLARTREAAFSEARAKLSAFLENQPLRHAA